MNKFFEWFFISGFVINITFPWLYLFVTFKSIMFSASWSFIAFMSAWGTASMFMLLKLNPPCKPKQKTRVERLSK